MFFLYWFVSSLNVLFISQKIVWRIVAMVSYKMSLVTRYASVSVHPHIVRTSTLAPNSVTMDSKWARKTVQSVAVINVRVLAATRPVTTVTRQIEVVAKCANVKVIYKIIQQQHQAHLHNLW